MIRIWARTTVGDKITRSFIYESVDNFDENKFKLHLMSLCHTMDIPTPIVTQSQIKSFSDFNIVTFIPRDFVEWVDFEKLILENAILSK